MPSSTARPTRYGGASATRSRRAARRSRASVLALVRARRGGRASCTRRTRLRATTSPRPSAGRGCRVRWPPGCWTLMRPPRSLHPVSELALEQAVLVDLAVDGVRPRAARRAVPRATIATAVEHDDLVGEGDRRQAVRDDDRRPAAHRLAQADPDLRLGRRVDRGGRVVEDQDARVDDQARARSRARWRWPPESVIPRSPITVS